MFFAFSKLAAPATAFVVILALVVVLECVSKILVKNFRSF